MGWDKLIRWESRKRGHERLNIIVPRLVRHYFILFLICQFFLFLLLFKGVFKGRGCVFFSPPSSKELFLGWGERGFLQSWVRRDEVKQGIQGFFPPNGSFLHVWGGFWVGGGGVFLHSKRGFFAWGEEVWLFLGGGGLNLIIIV